MGYDPFWHYVRYLLHRRALLTALVNISSNIMPSRRALLRELVSLHLITDNGQLTKMGERLVEYFARRNRLVKDILNNLRTLNEAKRDLDSRGILYQEKRTRSGVSYNIVEAEVRSILESVCKHMRVSYRMGNVRVVFRIDGRVFVLSKMVDGVIPAPPENPMILLEIKEYWGKKHGGSKMTNAIYESYVVARELNDFMSIYGIKVYYVVIIDGKEQWAARMSDLGRFVDLVNMGLIDRLFYGRNIQQELPKFLKHILSSNEY